MRTIAILGRPNVGKSTLFNRLAGRRKALVHDLPGVTRDRLEGEGRLGNLTFRMVDTAGMEPAPAQSLSGRLLSQSLAGLAEADLGLFLIDARAGITALDLELAAILRRSGKPILLLANKAEGRAAQAGLAEAWQLGLGEPLPISAEHGDGMADLLDALRPHLEISEADDLQPAAAGPPTKAAEDQPDGEDEALDRGAPVLKLAVVGRPNVGKSSIINRLLESERLLTGPEPGLTRDAVDIAWEWQGRQIQLVDTAGLRRKARIDAAIERLSASSTVRAIRGSHVVCLVIDATLPLEHQDLTIAGLAIEEGRAPLILANKWDLVEDPSATIKELKASVADRLAQVKGITVLPLSARTGRHMDRLIPTAVEVYDRWRKRIPTGQLNRFLATALEHHPPPLVQNRRLKIRYMTQVASRPPTFALFANKPATAMPDSYLRYLATGLRETFDLAGVPLRLYVRHGENPYDRR